jgi:hypothetical protein
MLGAPASILNIADTRNLLRAWIFTCLDNMANPRAKRTPKTMTCIDRKIEVSHFWHALRTKKICLVLVLLAGTIRDEEKEEEE